MFRKLMVGVVCVSLFSAGVFAGNTLVSAQTAPQSTGITGSQWVTCAQHGGWCDVGGYTVSRNVRYGIDGAYNYKNVTGGTACNHVEFGDPAPGNAYKHCDYEVAVYQPVVQEMGLTDAEWKNIITFDRAGTHGVPYATPWADTVGHACGAPTIGGWKSPLQAQEAISDQTRNRGSSWDHGVYGVWNEVYNACKGSNSRPALWNARIEQSPMATYAYFFSQRTWIQIQNMETNGGAFVEDFKNDEHIDGDITIAERPGFRYVRSGIWNALGNPGKPSWRKEYVGDDSVGYNDLGYNYHGYPNRDYINWHDVAAIITVQAMRCVPGGGNDLTDCNKEKYIANVGIDAFDELQSRYNGFQNQDSVGFSRFKPITTSWQLFTNYVGPKDFAGVGTPPIPAL